jgi:hypothetical protein
MELEKYEGAVTFKPSLIKISHLVQELLARTRTHGYDHVKNLAK